VSSSQRRNGDVAPASVPDVSRWGAPAPLLLRTVAVAGWLALVARVAATALPGSRSGIGPWIRRTDSAASLLTQLSALFGATLLVLLVVGTLAERSLGYAYRLVVVPTSAAVFILVIASTVDLASKLGMEPEATLMLGLACLALSTTGATAAMNAPPSRAQGLVVSLVTLGAATRLAVRVLTMGATHHDAAWVSRVAWLSALGAVFDTLGLALAAARFRAEQRTRGMVALVGVLALTLWVAWSALRGSMDGASTWQVLASRGIGELSQAAVPFGSASSRYTLMTLAVFFSGAVVLWPGRISAGMMSVALAILARPGVDVPAAALVLSLGALIAPLSRASFVEQSPASPSRATPGEQSPAGADR
jgi:hypothetical protein